MKKPCGIYLGEEGRRYLAVYNYQHDVSVMLPPKFRSMERVARMSYSRGGRKGGVDVFLLDEGPSDVDEIAQIKKVVSREGNLVTMVKEDAIEKFKVPASGVIDQAYDIQGQVVTHLENIGLEAINLTRADIYNFCGENIAKKPRGAKIEQVEKIIPVTGIRRIKPERVLTGGKAEFVPQCFLEANIDYSKGCFASWIPGENPSFDGQFFTDWFSYLWGDCEYCYAGRKHRMFPKTIYEFDQQRLIEELMGGAQLVFGSEEPLGKPVDVLRFGKRTEPWTPFTQDEFVGTLEAMVQTGTRGIITTKFMPFDPEIVNLAKKTKSTVLYSIGFEDLEAGCIEHGYDNNYRLNQARQYREAGVNSILYLLFHPIFEPTERELSVLEFAEKHKLPIQLLPMRMITKALAQKTISPLVGDQNAILWDVLKDTHLPSVQQEMDIMVEYEDSYYVQSSVLIPKINRMHPFWMDLIKSNKGRIRMCHHDEEQVYCGGCFCGPPSISPTQEIELNPSGVPKIGKRQKKEEPPKIEKPASTQIKLLE